MLLGRFLGSIRLTFPSLDFSFQLDTTRLRFGDFSGKIYTNCQYVYEISILL